MIKAINDVVVIERDLYAGAIIVNEKMAHGVIVSVGPGRWKASVRDLKPDGTVKENWYPTSLQIGQRVCFSLDKGEEHRIEGKRLVVMREDDIAGVIEEAA
jgi:co-chaperonin GroES (HSP10)